MMRRMLMRRKMMPIVAFGGAAGKAGKTSLLSFRMSLVIVAMP